MICSAVAFHTNGFGSVFQRSAHFFTSGAVWESAVADGAPSPDLRCPFEHDVTRPANASGVRTGFGRECACRDLARLNR